MRAPRSLNALTALFTTAFLLATVGTGYATYTGTRATIVRLVDRRIEIASRIVAGEHADPAGRILARIARFDDRRSTGDIGFILRDRKGRRIGGNIDLARALPAGFSTLQADDHVAGLTAGRALVRTIGNGMQLTTIAETEPVENYNAARIRIYLQGFVPMIAIVLVGQIVFARIVGRRIAEMRQAVDAIIDGDMDRRVAVDPAGGAFADQAIAFNRMIDRIAELMAGLANVSNDIAHDLRTPLARLRGLLARTRRRPEAAALSDEFDTAIAQCDELLAMFTAILRIAELQGSERHAGFGRIDVAATIAEVVQMMAPVAEEGGRSVVAAGSGPVWVEGDARLLGQAAVNLIENALVYTPAGSHIVTETGRIGDRAFVTISDDGPGIPAADRVQALRRFGRLESSRTQPGHGLGLPLVTAIIGLHGGDVHLEDAEPGLRVRITLPAI